LNEFVSNAGVFAMLYTVNLTPWAEREIVSMKAAKNRRIDFISADLDVILNILMYSNGNKPDK
jgi:hypothetical protein